MTSPIAPRARAGVVIKGYGLHEQGRQIAPRARVGWDDSGLVLQYYHNRPSRARGVVIPRRCCLVGSPAIAPRARAGVLMVRIHRLITQHGSHLRVRVRAAMPSYYSTQPELSIGSGSLGLLPSIGTPAKAPMFLIKPKNLSLLRHESNHSRVVVRRPMLCKSPLDRKL